MIRCRCCIFVTPRNSPFPRPPRLNLAILVVTEAVAYLWKRQARGHTTHSPCVALLHVSPPLRSSYHYVSACENVPPLALTGLSNPPHGRIPWTVVGGVAVPAGSLGASQHGFDRGLCHTRPHSFAFRDTVGRRRVGLGLRSYCHQQLQTPAAIRATMSSFEEEVEILFHG